MSSLEDWKYLITFKDGKKLYYLPARTITDSASGFVRAWFKTSFPEANKDISEVVFLDEFNCDEGKIRDLQTTVYYRDGKTETQTSVGEWKEVLPFSMAEIMIAAACAPDDGVWK